MKQITSLLAVLFTASILSPAMGQVSVEALMQQKLQSSQSLLKAMALEDYENIDRNTMKLHLLSREVGWNVIQSKDYIRISRDFRNAAEQMSKAAKKQNLDGVGLGYFKLTMSCIDCHRHVRATRRKANLPTEKGVER